MSHSVTLMLFISVLFLPNAISQGSISDCTSRLLILAPCAPFAQGMVEAPVQMCCDNLKEVYSQEPSCLCLLLNDTTIGSTFPINRTLALQLPQLCALNADLSICSDSFTPPPSQVSHGSKSNSTVAASPVIQVAPKPSIFGREFSKSGSTESNREDVLAVVTGVAFLSVMFFI